MNNDSRSHVNAIKGFTLIELMLVTVIISMILYAAVGYIQQRTEQLRINRTSMQMQQILSAGLAYYVANAAWPPSMACLQGQGPSGCVGTIAYLPSQFNSPWQNTPYTVAAVGPQFSVSVTVLGTITGPKTAQVLAGTLPSATISIPLGPTATGFIVTAYVNIPPQNLNNARAVNFAGLYHHGGCVPVPTCPVDPSSGIQMVPQIMVAPVSVSGVNDPGSNNVYPISSFTAYATGNASPPTNAKPPACAGGTGGTGGTSYTPSSDCETAPNNGIAPASGAYWRVCLQIITEKGNVQDTQGTTKWGDEVTVTAITRCAVPNEPAGSTFSVYSD